MDAPDRHSGQMDKETNGIADVPLWQFVISMEFYTKGRNCVCLLSSKFHASCRSLISSAYCLKLSFSYALTNSFLYLLVTQLFDSGAPFRFAITIGNSGR